MLHGFQTLPLLLHVATPAGGSAEPTHRAHARNCARSGDAAQVYTWAGTWGATASSVLTAVVSLLGRVGSGVPNGCVTCGVPLSQPQLCNRSAARSNIARVC